MAKILGILGPTAVGKTHIAKILAQKLNSNIVSADSMQIYKELNIGTAKATNEELDGIKQYMVDIINPDDTYSSFDYAQQASSIISNLLDNNVSPILAGGTGFYFDSLLYPLSYSNDNVEAIRKNLNEELLQNSPEFMHDKLMQIDPISAQQIHPNNTKKVIRALEIFYSTGQKKSDFKLPQNPKFPTKLYVLTMDREVLYQRINQRVDKMVQLGLVDEVKELISKYPQNCQSFTAIGYKEIIEYLNGFCDLECAINDIKQHTRNYAKRQLTYFSRFKDAKWIDVDVNNPQNTANQILKDFLNE